MARDLQRILTDLDRDGFVVLGGLLDPACVERVRTACRGLSQLPRRSGGLRDALRRLPEARALLASDALQSLLADLLGPRCFAVRAILFDKTVHANWNLGWHQDVSIAVCDERREVPGFGPWSRKQGVVHVRAPAAVLEGMLTLRLHLDACPVANGALRVLPGSHRLGRLTAAELRDLSPQKAVDVPADVGDVLLMRGLLVHGSRRSMQPAHRRILHIEWAAAALPGGLQWARAFCDDGVSPTRD